MTRGIKNVTSGDPRPAGPPKPGPTVGAGFARGLLEFAVKSGADREALMAAAQLTPEEIGRQDGRVPMMKYVALMRGGIRLSGDPALALHYGEAVNIAQVSIVGHLGRGAGTMGEALDKLNQYVRLIVEADSAPKEDRFSIVWEGDQRWLVDTRLNANAFPELTESAFSQLICHTREFGHEGSRPMVRAVHVTHERPGHWEEYERIWRAPVVFGAARNAMLMDPEWEFYRVAKTDPYVAGVLHEKADALMAELDAAKTMAGRVEAELRAMLHTGDVAIDTVAKRMGMSRPTLYRQLKAEGTTFEDVLEALRHRMAEHYLSDRKLSVGETAYLVGFSDPSAFSRAFKRWTGKSPAKR